MTAARPREDRADDDALMARVAMRDAAAFRTIVEEHAATPHRVAYRMTGDKTEAEDIAQEALLRLWEHAGRWRGGGAGITAWLTRVATNLCLDRLRRRRFASDAEPPDREDETPRADALLDAERTRVAAKESVGALPANQRAAIVLTYYEDLSNIMAADTLGMNIKAFESLLLRARRALRAAFEARGFGDAS